MGLAAMGGFMLLACFPLLFWNEGRAVTTARSLKEAAEEVIAVDATRVDPANEGKLIHFSGKAETSETLLDDQFGVSVQAVRLIRRVEMFQWQEFEEEVTRKRDGEASEKVTEYTYQTVWHDEPIDSSQFRHAAGHQNPPRMPFVSRTIEAADVRVAAYRLPSSLVAKIDHSEPLLVDLAKVPESLAKNLTADGGPTDNAQGFYWPVAGPNLDSSKGPSSVADQPTDATEAEDSPADDPPANVNEATPAEPSDPEPPLTDIAPVSDPPANDPADDEPQIGDLRISFVATYPAEVSVMAQQVGESLQPFQTSAGDKVNWLVPGRRSAAEIIGDREAANTFMTWALRIVGTLMAIFGVALVLRPLTMFTDWVPVLGNVIGFGVVLIAVAIGGAASLVTIAVAWLFYRPLLAISILVVAVLLVVGAVFAVKSLRGDQGTDRFSQE